MVGLNIINIKSCQRESDQQLQIQQFEYEQSIEILQPVYKLVELEQNLKYKNSDWPFCQDGLIGELQSEPIDETLQFDCNQGSFK